MIYTWDWSNNVSAGKCKIWTSALFPGFWLYAFSYSQCVSSCTEMTALLQNPQLLELEVSRSLS